MTHWSFIVCAYVHKPNKKPNAKQPLLLHTKGYSIGSAALACFLLFGAFLDEFSQFSGKPFRVVDIAVPEVLIGGLLGAFWHLPDLFVTRTGLRVCSNTVVT